MYSLVCLFSIFLISAQALEREVLLGTTKEMREEHESLKAELKSWLEKTVADLEKEVQGQVVFLKEEMEAAKIGAHKEITDKYELAKRHIRSIQAPQGCLEEAELKLSSEEGKSKSNFFRCSNLTAAATDGVALVAAAGRLVSDLLLSADNLLNGFGDCISFNPFTTFPCVFRWAVKVFKDVFGVGGKFAEFFKDIDRLLKDMRSQVDYCLHGETSALLIHTAKTVQQIHRCAQENAIN